MPPTNPRRLLTTRRKKWNQFETAVIYVRCPGGLHNDIAWAAALAGLSINAWCCRALQDQVQLEEQTHADADD